MAIAFDAASFGVVNPATSLSVAHTCTGSNRALCVAVAGDNSDLVTGATYNGVAMTLVNKTGAGGGRWGYLYYLNAPATGTNNIVVSASGSIFIEINAASYTGVSQTGQPEANNTNGALASASLTTAVTTVSANAWAVLAAVHQAGTLAAGSGSTVRATDVIGGIFDSNADIVSPGSYSMTFSGASGAESEAVIASLAPVGGGGATSNPPRRRSFPFSILHH